MHTVLDTPFHKISGAPVVSRPDMALQPGAVALALLPILKTAVLISSVPVPPTVTVPLVVASLAMMKPPAPVTVSVPPLMLTVPSPPAVRPTTKFEPEMGV